MSDGSDAASRNGSQPHHLNDFNRERTLAMFNSVRRLAPSAFLLAGGTRLAADIMG